MVHGKRTSNNEAPGLLSLGRPIGLPAITGPSHDQDTMRQGLRMDLAARWLVLLSCCVGDRWDV